MNMANFVLKMYTHYLRETLVRDNRTMFVDVEQSSKDLIKEIIFFSLTLIVVIVNPMKS